MLKITTLCYQKPFFKHGLGSAEFASRVRIVLSRRAVCSLTPRTHGRGGSAPMWSRKASPQGEAAWQQPKQSNATTRRLAVRNLALRGIEADFGPERADTFRSDLHPDLRADYVLANPPFNDSDWFRKDDNARWQFSGPPKGNANFAWVRHFIHHLAPQGMAGFVLANGSMSSNQSGEGDTRLALIEADLVHCMVALLSQLFYSTQILVCLWFLAKNKAADAKRGFRDRRKQPLLIDARKLGTRKATTQGLLWKMELRKRTVSLRSRTNFTPGHKSSTIKGN
jgi:type I restriction-modification system DNA methylase subunit